MGQRYHDQQPVNRDSNFEFSQSSAQLCGGVIGMAPFRVWKNDCVPIWKDNTTIGPGDGLFESDFTNQSAEPVKIRFYGAI